MIHPSTVDLFALGAALGLPPLNPGQWWRVLTAMFVHVGAVHLLMNMPCRCGSSGCWVELLARRRWMLFVYMVTGLFADGVARWHMTCQPGASGAVWGCFGVFWGMCAAGGWGLRRR